MRFANGVVSAAIVVFFLAHATLGTLLGLIGFMSPLAWLVWVGVALVGVHVMLSIFTSREQLTDSSIKIADIEEEKKAVMDEFKERLKPLNETKGEAIKALREKSQTVTEKCYQRVRSCRDNANGAVCVRVSAFRQNIHWSEESAVERHGI